METFKANFDLPEISRDLPLTFLMLGLLPNSLLELKAEAQAHLTGILLSKEAVPFPLLHPGYTNLPGHRASVLAPLQTEQRSHGEK